ncbi:hypothetical protein C7293_06625 [filamentous cyanobacterium CCT1]|nr:hypothetical protein C7293_06625 [filamentous cyanobacterium CCT1]
MVQAQPLNLAALAWEPLPDLRLCYSPLGNIQPPFFADALTEALGAAQRIQPEMLIGSNIGLVASVNNQFVFKAPSWLYVPRVNSLPSGMMRYRYLPNVEGDPVATVIEFLSEKDNGELSLRSTKPYGSLYIYEQILQVPTYVIYAPQRARLEVRCLQNGRYEPQAPNALGHFWIPQLELFLGLWHGERLAQTLNWLRWWDADGNLLLWSSEQAEREAQRAEAERQRAEAERQRADRLAALLRAQGIDPDQLP